MEAPYNIIDINTARDLKLNVQVEYCRFSQKWQYHVHLIVKQLTSYSMYDNIHYPTQFWDERIWTCCFPIGKTVFSKMTWYLWKINHLNKYNMQKYLMQDVKCLIEKLPEMDQSVLQLSNRLSAIYDSFIQFSLLNSSSIC